MNPLEKLFFLLEIVAMRDTLDELRDNPELARIMSEKECHRCPLADKCAQPAQGEVPTSQPTAEA